MIFQMYIEGCGYGVIAVQQMLRGKSDNSLWIHYRLTPRRV